MASKIDDIYTIQQLSEICNCSVPVARKYVLRNKYKESAIQVNGRTTKAYNIPISALQTMKQRIAENKSKLSTQSSATNSTNEIYNSSGASNNILESFENSITSKAQEYWQLYITEKEQRLQLQTEIKLLEDKSNNKEAIYVKEINDLRADIEEVNSKYEKQSTELKEVTTTRDTLTNELQEYKLRHRYLKTITISLAVLLVIGAIAVIIPTIIR